MSYVPAIASQSHHRACALLREEWQRRGMSPEAIDGSWLDGLWGEVLAAVEQRSRSGDAHIPLRELLAAARSLAAEETAAVAGAA